MAPGISYDDSGSLASYFGVTFLAIILLPFTYIALRPTKKDSAKPLCPCQTCRERSAQLSSIETGRRKRTFWRRILPLSIGWALLAFLCYRIAQAPPIEGNVVYNPFEILGISDSSTEKQIKKHYKKLSLQFHPDKIQLAENQTQEEADAKFVELTKAYKSLTDEVTRENLAKYGNPDGPQQREDKIAIPKWVVEGRNNVWVLGAYGLVLGGGIPYIVGRWWFSQRRLTRDGVLNATAETFFYNLKDDTDFVSLVSLLACAAEFASLLGGKKRGSKKERKERQARVDELDKVLDIKREEAMVIENPTMRKDNKVTVTTAVAKRAKALLWAHLLRLKLQDKELEAEQLDVLRKLPLLLNAMLNISLAHNWLNTSLLIVKLQAALVQALPPSASPLAQLPGVDAEEAFELGVTSGAEGKRWAEKAEKKGVMSDEAKEVLHHWPRLEITRAEFKVVGEKIVTPSSIVQLSFEARYVYPSTSTTTTSFPTPKVLPNGDVQEKAGGADGEAISGKDSVTDVEEQVTKVGPVDDEKSELREKLQSDTAVEEKRKLENGDAGTSKVGQEGKKVEGEKTYDPNGYAHAPHWPQLRKPHFQVLLGDSKLDKVIVQPIRITDLPLPRKDGLPSEPREFSLQFQAPPQANLYSFVLYAASDTFLGADLQRPIMLKVEDPPPENELSDDDDISEPDEDTLAGQMAMMRGDKVKPSAVHGGHGHGSGDDDGSVTDESEYEYESESSSDEDGPKGGAAGANKAKSGKGRTRAINEDSDSDSD